MSFPKITVVTPCYNMEKYIESTILSVIRQGYPNLEYIVVDGGSTDGTMEIINRYRDNISLVISGKDGGMYDAIARGFAASSGEIMAWLNADDIYLVSTLSIVSQIFTENPDIQWLCGMPAFMNDEGQIVRIANNAGTKSRKDIENGWFRKEIYNYLQQEGMFWRKSLWKTSGGLNLKYRYAGDFELWMRFAKYADLVTAAMPFSAFRRRADSLSIDSNKLYLNEIQQAITEKPKYPNFLWKIIPFNFFFICFLRILTFRKSKLCFYSFKNGKFAIRNILRSISYNTVSDLYYEFKFRK